MPKKSISVSVEDSGYNFTQGVAKFIAAVKLAHKGGANLAVEIPADVAAAIADLIPLLSEVGHLGPDFSEDKLAFAKGVNIGVYDIIGAAFS